MTVYMIINNANGKYYVGKTVRKDLQRYFREQLRYAFLGRYDKPYLYNAFRKYGHESFRIHPLISTLQTNEQLCEWERFLIALFRSRDRNVGYNITKGGDGVVGLQPFLGRRHSAVTRDKMRVSAMGNHRGVGLQEFWTVERRGKQAARARAFTSEQQRDKGLKGAAARWAKTTAEQRSEIGRKLRAIQLGNSR